MKKAILLLAITVATILVNKQETKAQTLDTVNVSTTLRLQDWVWAIGKFGSGKSIILDN